MAKKLKTKVREAAAQLKIIDYIDYKFFLSDLFAKLNENEKNFTHKLFAVSLGFSPTNITIEYIKGRRPITEQVAEKIAANLGLSGHERKYFIYLVQYQNSKDPEERRQAQKRMLDYKSRLIPNELDRRTSDYISTWIHPVIREIVRLKDFQENADWIREKLRPRLKTIQIEESINLLIELGFLRREVSGKLEQSEPTISTGHRVKSLELRNYHSEMIDLGKSSLVDIEGKLRHIAGLTIPLNAKDRDEINEILRSMLEKILLISEKSKDADNVYQLNLQFFPLTKD